MDAATNQMLDVPDAALVSLYANGDDRAANELSRRVVPPIFRLALRLLGDRSEAEDVAQEVMLKLWQIAPDWDAGRARPTTWAYKVARNLCLDRLRRKPPVGIDEIAEPSDERPSVETQLQSSERLTALDKALSTLPERQRVAVVLRHLEGLGNPEIAEILDISIEAVESLTARGKRAISKALRHQKEELGL